MSPDRAAAAPSFATDTQLVYPGGANAAALSSAVASAGRSLPIMGVLTFAFIQAWSGQSGNGFTPQEPPSGSVPFVEEAESLGAGADAATDADADADTDPAVFTGEEADATAVAVVALGCPPPDEVSPDLVHATPHIKRETAGMRRSRRTWMGMVGRPRSLPNKSEGGRVRLYAR